MMITKEVQEFLEYAGTVLVLEDKEPKFVIAKFKEYMDTLKSARQGHMTVDDALALQGESNSAQRENAEQRQVLEINRELEAISTDDFFAQPFTENTLPRKNPPQPFYRELE